jgi:hypothetical protein
MKMTTICFYCYDFDYVIGAEAMLSVFWGAGTEESVMNTRNGCMKLCCIHYDDILYVATVCTIDMFVGLLWCTEWFCDLGVVTVGYII